MLPFRSSKPKRLSVNTMALRSQLINLNEVIPDKATRNRVIQALKANGYSVPYGTYCFPEDLAITTGLPLERLTEYLPRYSHIKSTQDEGHWVGALASMILRIIF